MLELVEFVVEPDPVLAVSRDVPLEALEEGRIAQGGGLVVGHDGRLREIISRYERQCEVRCTSMRNITAQSKLPQQQKWPFQACDAASGLLRHTPTYLFPAPRLHTCGPSTFPGSFTRGMDSRKVPQETNTQIPLMAANMCLNYPSTPHDLISRSLSIGCAECGAPGLSEDAGAWHYLF